MSKLIKVGNQEYYMDNFLQKNLELAKAALKKDWDMVICIDGMEGSGKSVITQQIAYYCDPTLTVDRITFTPKEFRDAILNAKKYQAIVYDEAYTGLSSRSAMSGVNKALVSMLAEIRQKNLFVFVVMPTFFDLDKYVAVWRSRALIHVYTKQGFERGRFAFFNVDRKKMLYMGGKKFYNYGVTKANFVGDFRNHYTVDEPAYRKKKAESLSDKDEELSPRHIKWKAQRDALIYMLNKEQNIEQTEIAKRLKITQQAVSDSILRYTRVEHDTRNNIV